MNGGYVLIVLLALQVLAVYLLLYERSTATGDHHTSPETMQAQAEWIESQR
jgi:hypothetical protein